MRHPERCSGPPAARERGRRVRSVLITAAALGVAALALSGCGGSGGDAQAASDPAAVRTLHQAASAMGQTTGYRFAATVGSAPAQVQLLGELQAPDRVHETIEVAGKASAEVVFIGSKAFVRDPKSGSWRNRVQGGAPTSTDVRTAFATLALVHTVTRNGATYTFEVPASATQAFAGSTATGTVTGSAHVTNGLIDTLTYRATVSGQVVDVRIEFTDMNNAPAVVEPTVT